MRAKKSLTATNLAVYQHLSCDLYIHNVYHGASGSGHDFGASNPFELSKAHLKRGLDWETTLFSWLDRSNLLLQVPSIPLEADTLLENILADERSHFFISGLTFWPPKGLKQRFSEIHAEPLAFGLAKPDLIEVTRVGELIRWRVIDAKASKHVKSSHHIQIYFYTLCLNYLLDRFPYQNTDTAGVWLPRSENLDIATPSTNDIKTVSISLLAPALDVLLFKELPKVIALPFEEVKWHFNPLCHGCHYESGCRTRAQEQREIGSIPNISIDDARLLKDLLRISRASALPKSEHMLPDIEELHELFEDQAKVDLLAKASTTLVKKAKQILALPRKVPKGQKVMHSPVIEAARTKGIQVIPRRNYTCPSKEDIAVILSIVNDPSSPSRGGDYFCVTVHSGNPHIVPPPAFLCPASDFIAKLANLIRSIEAMRKVLSLNTCQFYVWSMGENISLQSSIIQAALTFAASSDDVRLCIGALAQGASLLQTRFQPMLLSGALLSFLANGKRTKVEYQVCLERMGLSTEGTAEDLRKRIDSEVRRLQEVLTMSGHEVHRRELGRLSQVVVLKKDIERQLALPIAGYWDLPECASLILSPGRFCPTDEQIFAEYKNLPNVEALEDLLVRRNQIIFLVLKAFRARVISANGVSFLVNEAKVLSTRFMDICKEAHIRKLFFMQQFEVLTKLTELWQSRIDGCPDAPVVQYCDVIQGAYGPEFVFRLISGIVDVPAYDRDYPFFDKLLVRDAPNGEDGSDKLPVEALFDDLGLSGLVFPLNRYTKANWNKQDLRVQQELSVADVRNVYLSQDRQHTMVTLRIWDTGQLVFNEGDTFRLSPRLVDFNTTKVLSALFEIDLLWETENQTVEQGENTHHGIPFLQLITDPNSLGKVPMAEQYKKAENEIQKLFRDLRDLGNTSASSLVLQTSQRKATQRILSNRLSVIWGPPGTGKTYTISLSLLRLIAVERRFHGSQPKIIFMTAITHAAIEACRRKLAHLMSAYRSIASLPKSWLDDVYIHNVSRGNDHPPPLRTGSAVQIYAGTIYQLYNFTKKYAMEVDCVIVDEAGQISLGSVSLVIRSLSPMGRIIIAGDSEQLAPILSAQYPLLKSHALFGSVLDCLMFAKSIHDEGAPLSSSIADTEEVGPSQGSIVQLTENFRLNADLGEFVSTIYSRRFKPQKAQARQLAFALRKLTHDGKWPTVLFPRELLDPVRAFLVALSKVMLKEDQSILIPPEFNSSSNVPLPPIISEIAVTPRPVSLSLVRLRSWSKYPQNISYELHVHIEAAVAAAFVLFLRHCCPNDDIFVATPHRIQREAVKVALAKIKVDEPIEDVFDNMHLEGHNKRSKVTVDTIERLQGSEASFVICLFSVPKSFTADLGFLLERRRLNVAISRAKTLCILISSDEVLCPPVKTLVNEGTAKGYAFLRAYQQRAWSYYLPLQLEKIL